MIANPKIIKLLEAKGYFDMTIESRTIANQKCMEQLKSIEKLDFDVLGSEENE